MDDIHLRDAQQHPMHLHYEHHGLHHINNNDGLEDDEHGHRNGAGGADELDGEMSPNPGNISDNHGEMVEHGGENGDQLTLSFQGQVYVFDSVSPQKVQTVLLLLGAHEVPAGPPTIPTTTHRNNAIAVVEGVPGNVQRFNVPQRMASLLRFRAKRKERNFDKKIRYSVRKEVALRMKRNKGQFTSAKPNNEDPALAGSNWDPNQEWASDANGAHNQETLCKHCGTSEKSTPMMRRGPEGPRTLCNACGLMWANKRTLRDLSKMPTPHAGQSSLNKNENGNFDADENVTIAENVDGSSSHEH